MAFLCILARQRCVQNFYLRAEEIPDNRDREWYFMDNNLIPIKVFNYSCVLGISDPGKVTNMIE